MLTIDSDFSGGNILVDSIDGDVVRLQQDIRTTTEWWFYWHFRVRGAAGRTVRFGFTNKDVFTAAGPCFSADGVNWRWLGRDVLSENGFSFSFPKTLDTAYFSVGVPYVESHLDAFLRARPAVERGVLTRTEAGRAAPLLRLRSKAGRRVGVITARTHACEAMASYTLEGVVDFWLTDASAEAGWLREELDLLVVPFVDADGVEAGDQGKNRAPHDHNRDYIDQPLYATTRAQIDLFAQERERIAIGLDLHCPWIRGRRNEDFYVVGPPPPWEDAAVRFAKVVEASRQGEVPLDARHYLPFGVEWNNNAQSRTLSRHIWNTCPNCRAAASVEVPYGVSSGVTMTADRSRAIGRDLARAIARFLQ